jgi:hypothetical protein
VLLQSVCIIHKSLRFNQLTDNDADHDHHTLCVLLYSQTSKPMFYFTVVLLCVHFNLSFSMMVSPFFNQFLAAAGAVYQLPSRYEFNILLLSFYVHVCKKLDELLDAAHNDGKINDVACAWLHLTTDFWTSNHQHKAYGTLVGSSITKEWELVVRTLGTAALRGTKSADVIAAWVRFMLGKRDCYERMVVTVTTDGAADMR